MYTARDIQEMTRAEFSAALLGAGAPFRYHVITIREFFRKMLNGVKQASCLFSDLISNPRALTESDERILSLGYQLPDIELVIPYKDLWNSMKNAIISEQDEFTYTLDNVEYNLTVTNILSDLQSKVDIAEVQVSSYTALLASSKEQVLQIMDAAVTKISANTYNGLLAIISDLKDTITGYFSENGVSGQAVAMVNRAFGLDAQSVDRASADSYSVWSGITGRTAYENFVTMLTEAVSTVGNIIYHSTTLLLRASWWLFKVILRAVAWVVEKVRNWAQKKLNQLQVGNPIDAEGAYYGYSSKYTKRCATDIHRYPIWYLFSQGLLSGSGYTMEIGNVRITIVADCPDASPDISWEDWLRLDQPNNKVYVITTVSPIFGGALATALEDFRVQGGFHDTHLMGYTMNASGYYTVAQGYSWDTTASDWAAILNCMNIIGNTDLRPSAELSDNVVARCFLIGHAYANLVLSIPFNELKFSSDTDVPTWISGRSYLNNWGCLMLSQMWCWSCTDLGSNFYLTSVQDLNIHFVYSTLLSDFTATASNVPLLQFVPWTRLIDNQTYNSNILGDAMHLDLTFGSNIWYARITSQVANGFGGYYTFKNVYKRTNEKVDYTLYIFGVLPENALCGIHTGSGSTGWYDTSAVGLYLEMIMNAWNNEHYTGAFIPYSVGEALQYDEYVIATDAEVNEYLSSYGHQLAIKGAIIVAAIFIGVLAAKAYKAYRQTLLLADTAAFQYGEAVLSGNVSEATRLWNVYRGAVWKSKLLSILSPASVASVVNSGLSGISNNEKSTATIPQISDLEENLSQELVNVKRLITG